MKIAFVIFIAFLVLAPAAVFQVLETGFIVGKEVSSVSIEVGQQLRETCEEVTSGLHESLDPLITEFEEPADKLMSTALELSLERRCIKSPWTLLPKLR